MRGPGSLWKLFYHVLPIGLAPLYTFRVMTQGHGDGQGPGGMGPLLGSEDFKRYSGLGLWVRCVGRSKWGRVR